VPSCPIYDIKEASEDPHISRARGMVVELDQPGLGTVKVQGNPIKMTATRPVPRGPAPALGGDTEDVLRELLGVASEEYKRLVESSVV
jgi:crotonobetainyl-CoA:carnitine CoA-transferase CaiB-like acyl-CoA transferase